MSHPRPKLVAIPSRWPLEPGTVRFLEPPGGLTCQQLEQLRRGDPAQPFILEESGMRHLLFTRDSVQSSMDCRAPELLTAAYVRKMMAFLLFKKHPRHIVMIGLGGGSLAKFCYRHLPEASVTVVEIDKRVIALRHEFNIPEDDERFRVIHEDGATFMARGGFECDVVLIDAFDAVGIAPSLATYEFYRSVANALTDDGVLVMNFFGVAERCASNLQKLRLAFKERMLLVPVRGEGNTLAFAFAAASMPALTGDAELSARQLQHEICLEFPSFLHRLRNAHRL